MTITKFDKMRSIKNQSEISDGFDFKCENCKSTKLDMFPLKIPYKPKFIDNNDLKNPYAFSYYNKLPTKKEALRLCVLSGDMGIKCKKCNWIFSVPNPFSKERMKDYIAKKVKDD